jgi:hypothetical protein
MWEYPRDAGAGEQMDFVEVMELDDDGASGGTASTGAGSASGCCSATNILVEVGSRAGRRLSLQHRNVALTAT